MAPGVQNSLLRAYFREQYMTLYGGRRREENPLFVDQFIDRRIEVFLLEVDEKLASVRQLEQEINALREGKASGPSMPLSRALRRLGDELGDLRRNLSPIFVELKGKSRFQPEIEGSHQESSFSKEFEFLHHKIDQAEEHIRNYLFSAGSTVSVGALQGGDMLVSLYEAAQMAKSLSKEFEG